MTPGIARHGQASLRPQHAQAGLRSRQRGITLFGLVFWAVLVGMGAYLLVRILPTVNEYLTVQRTVEQVARAQPATVAEARQAFDKQKELEYSITEVSGRDLLVTKENDKVVIGFAYNKLIPIYGPVFVLIKYEGSSR
jgi:hypothetical protein